MHASILHPVKIQHICSLVARTARSNRRSVLMMIIIMEVRQSTAKLSQLP
jgi:hypothetical protein